MGQMQAWTANLLRNVGKGSIDLVFPPSCLICMEEIISPTEDIGVCQQCLEEITSVKGPVCRRCAARIPEIPGQKETCPRCERDRLRFDATYSLGEYTGLLRDTVIQMKSDRSERYARLCSRLLLLRFGERLRELNFDAVLSIPTSPWRRWIRGTNAPAVMAQEIASTLQVPMARGLLEWVRTPLTQHGMSRAGRFRNVRGNLRVARGFRFDSPRLLIVDDVLTTGATCSEAARVLKSYGAEKVVVAVVGRTSDG